jgi:hypothetical protein
MEWTVSALTLRHIAECLKDILTQVWFRFDRQGISMINVDPEKIISAQLHLRPPTEQYSCGDMGYTFCCYVQTLHKVLRNVKDKDTAKISSGNMEDLKILIMSPDGVTKSRISMASLNDPMPQFDWSILNYGLEFTMASSMLYTVAHDLSTISRKLCVSVFRDTVTFEAKDETGTSVSSYFVCKGLQNNEITCKVVCITKYIEKFMKPSLSPSVTLHLQSGKPVQLEYTLPHGSLYLNVAALE